MASEYAVVFCALVNGIECCKTEGIVDVFEAVKTPTVTHHVTERL